MINHEPLCSLDYDNEYDSPDNHILQCIECNKELADNEDVYCSNCEKELDEQGFFDIDTFEDQED